jgi:hypothetical protein
MKRTLQLRRLLFKIRRRLGCKGIKRFKRFPLYVPQTRCGLLWLCKLRRLSFGRTVMLGEWVLPIERLKYLVLGGLLRTLYMRCPVLFCGRVGSIDKFSEVHNRLMATSDGISLFLSSIWLVGVVRSIGRNLLGSTSWFDTFLRGGGFVLHGGAMGLLAGVYRLLFTVPMLGVLGVKLGYRFVTCVYFFKTLTLAKRCERRLLTGLGVGGGYFWWFFSRLIGVVTLQLNLLCYTCSVPILAVTDRLKIRCDFLLIRDHVCFRDN